MRKLTKTSYKVNTYRIFFTASACSKFTKETLLFLLLLLSENHSETNNSCSKLNRKCLHAYFAQDGTENVPEAFQTNTINSPWLEQHYVLWHTISLTLLFENWKFQLEKYREIANYDALSNATQFTNYVALTNASQFPYFSDFFSQKVYSIG